MKGLMIELYSTTASFRDPGGQLYHDSLPIPPPSTLVGIAGAAIGLPYDEALKWIKENSVLIGCSGESNGSGRDLWNYIKIKSDRKDEAVTHAIILRTFVYKLKVYVYFACDNEEAVRKLFKAFKTPAFAITLGTSDEIAVIKKVLFFEEVTFDKRSDLINTWLAGDFSKKFRLDWNMVKENLKISLRAPIVKNLPVDFEFDASQVRKATKYIPITFLGEMQILEDSVEVVRFGGNYIPLLKL